MSTDGRNQKLAQLIVDLGLSGAKERLRLTKEATWLKVLQKTMGVSAVQESNNQLASLVVIDAIIELLGYGKLTSDPLRGGQLGRDQFLQVLLHPDARPHGGGVA